VNDPPSFDLENSAIVIGNTTTNNSVLVATNIDVGDGNTFETNQVVKFYVASDSNAGLFKTAPSVGINGVLSFAIKGGTNVGTATLTLYPKDNGLKMNGGNDTGATNTVTITITNVFDVPAAFNVTASGLEDTVIPVTLKGTNYDAFDLTVDPGLTFQVVSGPASGILSTNSVKTTNHYPVVNYTPNANANGTDTFTYQVSTVNYTSAVATATITIKPVNDAPTFTLSSGVAAGTTNLGTQTISGFVTNISAGPADESAQTVTFVVKPVVTTMFATGGAPAVNGTGDLTFALKANQHFTNTVSIYAKDSNVPPGISATNTFLIEVP